MIDMSDERIALERAPTAPPRLYAELLTVEEVAAALDLSPDVVHREIRARRLACYVVGRRKKVSPAQIDAYLESCLCPALVPTDRPSKPIEDPGASSGGTMDAAAAFRQARRIQSALGKPSRISRPALSAIP